MSLAWEIHTVGTKRKRTEAIRYDLLQYPNIHGHTGCEHACEPFGYD